MYDLVGVDGNAFNVMGYVTQAMRECKKNKPEIDAYFADARSGDYNHLLAVSFDMVDKLNKLKGYE